MDERISHAFADVLRSACTGSGVALFFPSLKHVSRNPHKLFRIVEIALTNGATIVTQNVLLEPGTVVRRADLEDHNREQLDAWWDDVKRPVELQRAPGPTSPSNAATSKTRRAKAARRTRRSGR